MKESLHLKTVAGYWKDQKGGYSYHKEEKKLTPWIAKHSEQIVKLDSQENLRDHPAYGEQYSGRKYDNQIWGTGAGSQCYSFLGLALQGTGGEVIGVLKVENKLPKDTAFNDNDVQLLKFISDIIVLAITRGS